MKILAVNAGSSSLKFQLYEMPDEKVLISGVFERIGINNSFYTIKLNGEKIKKELELKNHKQAFQILVDELLENKIIKSFDDIKGIGHRMVQGGSYYNKSQIVTNELLKVVEECSVLAPLHNPPAITGIKAATEVLPNAIQTVVFDTAFHQTMKEDVYLYPVPYEWYEKYGIRKYGMHGTSHKYISARINEILGTTNTKVIICHIGNGASITAVENGICVDTSMGLTPNAGLMMGTRSGDIDATIIPYIMKEANLTIDEVDNILNKESGLLGISGISSDSRDIEQGINDGNERCLLAQKMYVKKIVEYIAKYYVELGGCNAIVFTAGVGENSPFTRREVLEKLEVLGIKIDEEKNSIRGKETIITKPSSKISVYVIPTDEELMIARDTYNLIK